MPCLVLGVWIIISHNSPAHWRRYSHLTMQMKELQVREVNFLAPARIQAPPCSTSELQALTNKLHSLWDYTCWENSSSFQKRTTGWENLPSVVLGGIFKPFVSKKRRIVLNVSGPSTGFGPLRVKGKIRGGLFEDEFSGIFQASY